MNTVDFASLLASGKPARTRSSLLSLEFSTPTHACICQYDTHHIRTSRTQWSNTSKFKDFIFFSYFFFLLLLFHHPCTRSSRQRSQNPDAKSNSYSSQLIGIVTDVQIFSLFCSFDTSITSMRPDLHWRVCITGSLNKFRETNIYSYALAYPTFDLHSLFLSSVSKNKLYTNVAAHPLGGRHYLLTPFKNYF